MVISRSDRLYQECGYQAYLTLPDTSDEGCIAEFKAHVGEAAARTGAYYAGFVTR